MQQNSPCIKSNFFFNTVSQKTPTNNFNDFLNKIIRLHCNALHLPACSSLQTWPLRTTHFPYFDLHLFPITCSCIYCKDVSCLCSLWSIVLLLNAYQAFAYVHGILVLTLLGKYCLASVLPAFQLCLFEHWLGSQGIQSLVWEHWAGGRNIVLKRH